MALRTFRFETDIPFARSGMRSTGNDFAIYRQFDVSVVADDVVMIPLAGWFSPSFARQTAFPSGWMRPVRSKMRAVNRKDVAITGVVLRMVTIENLDLNRAREWLALRG